MRTELYAPGDVVLRTITDRAVYDAQTAYDLGLTELRHGSPRAVCHYCWTPLGLVPGIKGAVVHYDQIVPLVQGGPHDETNLALTCAPCNLSKGKLTPIEWAAASPSARRKLGIQRWYMDLGEECDELVAAFEAVFQGDQYVGPNPNHREARSN